ncbi:hypothetical protein ABZ372_33775 [Streptomyces sp. NPDC005921]|uniref:DUF1269 domain-containing protein n=1 Tax=Streptomyces sp. NPDC005827 TaxID=3157070 RepID=UPI00340B4652
MSMTENAVVLRFADRASAYQALSDLKHLTSATVELRGAVLIERLEDGTVRVPEGLETEAGRNTAVGGLVGSLVGILGGPLGILTGWGIGAVIGSGYDYKRAEETTGTVALLTSHMPPGGTAVLAEVRESDPQALDLLAMRYDAVVERRPSDSVRTELKAMEEAADRIRKEEAKDRRDRKRTETEQKIKDGVAQLKQKITG